MNKLLIASVLISSLVAIPATAVASCGQGGDCAVGGLGNGGVQSDGKAQGGNIQREGIAANGKIVDGVFQSGHVDFHRADGSVSATLSGNYNPEDGTLNGHTTGVLGDCSGHCQPF